jgi:hypothetical protein
VNRSLVEQADFRLTAVTVEGALVRARIDGNIRLLHSFFPNGKSADYAVSELTGYMDFDAAQRRIQRLRIVTNKGEYPQTVSAASLVSMSKETLDAFRNAGVRPEEIALCGRLQPALLAARLKSRAG